MSDFTLVPSRRPEALSLLGDLATKIRAPRYSKLDEWERCQAGIVAASLAADLNEGHCVEAILNTFEILASWRDVEIDDVLRDDVFFLLDDKNSHLPIPTHPNLSRLWESYR